MTDATVWQAQNGVMYLCIEDGVKVGRTICKKFVVNTGQQVTTMLLDVDTVTSRGLVKLDKINLLPVLNRLLHPLSSCVTVDPVVQGILSQIFDKEAEMAKTAAKTATPAAPAATPAKAAKFAKKGETAPANGSPDHKPPMTEEDLKGTELYQKMVVTTGKGAEANEGSFFKLIHTSAEKPIKLADLIDNLVADEKLVLKSAKDRKTVVRVRTRDAFTRLGYLQEAVGAKK